MNQSRETCRQITLFQMANQKRNTVAAGSGLNDFFGAPAAAQPECYTDIVCSFSPSKNFNN